MSRIFKKTLVLMFVLFVFLSAVTSFFAAWILHDNLQEEFESKALAIGDSLSRSSPEPFLSRDAATIQSLIDHYLEIRGVVYAAVTYPDGFIVAHTFIPTPPEEFIQNIRSKTGHTGGRYLNTLNIWGKKCLDVCSPILEGKGGYIHVGMDMSMITSTIKDAVIKIQIATLLALLMAASAASILVNRISRPLKQLSNYAQELANQNFTAELDLTAKDEIGDLASIMRVMALRLHSFISTLEKQIQGATEELRETLIYLTVILENIADGLLIVDEYGEISQFNQALVDILKLPDDRIASMSMEEILGPETAKHFILSEGQSGNKFNTPQSSDLNSIFRLQTAITNGDNDEIFVDISVSRVPLSCGVNQIVLIRDITAQKKQEQALHEAREKLEIRVQERTRELVKTNDRLTREIKIRKQAEADLEGEKELFAITLRSIGDGVVTSDTSNHITFMNQAAEIFTGWNQKEALGQTFSEVMSLKGRELEPTNLNPIHEAEASWELGEERRYILASRDGIRQEIGLKLSPIIDRKSQLIGSVVVFRDLEQQKRDEENRLRTEKLTSVGLLAGGIAHDFNNILTAILNNIILVRTKLSEDDHLAVNLKQAEKAVVRAQRLTRQLLTFSKGGAPVREQTNIAELIRESATFALRGSNSRCVFEIPEKIWTANVDPGQISQVIENIIINADQAMPAGGEIKIQVNNYLQENDTLENIPQGRYLRIRVIDQGPGIAQENLKRIFDPYFSTKKDGSGLGLATVYSIVHRHGGAVDVYSQEGMGSTFTIYLPALKKTPPSTKEQTERPLPGTGRILLMDDETDIVNVVSEALLMLGYEVEGAATGEEALKKYSQAMEVGKKFDLVIMDLTIPGGMGGQEAVGHLLEMDPKARAIVSSGYSQNPIMADCRHYGFMDVLSKPFSIHELATKLNEILNPNREDKG